MKSKFSVDLARDLINKFGGLRQLLCVDIATFCQAKGLGQAKYVQLQVSFKMSRRFFRKTIKREGPLSNPDEAKQFLLIKNV